MSRAVIRKQGAPKKRQSRGQRLPLTSNLSYRISRLNFYMGRATADIYGREGLTAQQWKVVSVLFYYEPLPASGILIYVSLDKAAVSRVVQQLLKMELIERRLRARDGRILDLVLTQKARKIYTRMAENMAVLQAELFGDATEEQAASFFAMLDAIEERLHPHSGVGSDID